MDATAKLPLFDRLSGELSPFMHGRGLSADGLQRSIRLDLERLLNTRNGLTVREFLDCDGGVMHYGMPDTLALSALADQVLLSHIVRKAIDLYEPRLSRVDIQVLADKQALHRLKVQVRGAVKLGGHLSRVDFELDLGGSTATVVAGGSAAPKGAM